MGYDQDSKAPRLPTKHPASLDAAGEPPATMQLDKDLLSACIHCGLCLPHCPTYLATGREMESPRGRIYLINEWQAGNLQMEPRMAEHIESCLGCLGCETACPSGVRYEKILDQVRPHLALMRSGRKRALMRFVFRKLLPDYGKLRHLGRLMRFAQMTGAYKVVTRLSFGMVPSVKRLVSLWERWQSFLPSVPEFRPLPKQSWKSGAKKGSVKLFSGCVMDIFYNQVNHACINCLTQCGFIVEVPEQTCCGALAFHAGEIDIAQDLARRNIELAEAYEDSLVVTGSGCAAMLKHYPELFSRSDAWHKRAEAFCRRVSDFTEFLAKQRFPNPPRSVKRKVAYHAACHLAHAQGIHEGPAELLSQIEGITLIPLNEAEHCCGSAGIFNLTHTELSLKVLERKVACIQETGAELVVTTNPGCLLQLQAGLRAANLPVQVLHLAEILDQVYGMTEPTII